MPQMTAIVRNAFPRESLLEWIVLCGAEVIGRRHCGATHIVETLLLRCLPA